MTGLDDPSAGGSASPSPAPGGTTVPPDNTEPSSAGQTTQSTTTSPETTTAGETATERTSVVTAPDVVGLRVERAIQRLRAVGLRAATSTVVSEQPPGTVVDQRPSAGDRVERGSAVRIQVARAKPVQTVRVPPLVGLTVSQAKWRLGQVGLRWSVVTVSSDSADGTVSGQSPSSGAKVREATTITLRVSSGPSSVAVPDVVGDSEASARATLQSAGFDVTVVEEPTEDPAADGVVTAQDPPAAKQLREGSPVTITVGRFTPPPTTG